MRRNLYGRDLMRITLSKVLFGSSLIPEEHRNAGIMGEGSTILNLDHIKQESNHQQNNGQSGSKYGRPAFGAISDD